MQSEEIDVQTEKNMYNLGYNLWLVILGSMPSVLWCCWLGTRKDIRPVKIERWGTGVVNCLCVCKWFAYSPTDANVTPSSLAPVKSRMVYLSGAGLPRLSWKKAT